jgi:hypothetical protein
MPFAALANRAAPLDKGRIIIDGAAAEKMTDSKMMSEHRLEVPARSATLRFP